MHSIWLMPDSETRKKLRSLNENIAGALNSPLFEPHITLIGDIPGDVEQTRAVCSELFGDFDAGPAKFAEVSLTDAYFMFFFANVSVSADLWAKRKKLANALGVEVAAWQPHFSLAYGSGMLEQRKSLSSTVEETLGGQGFNISSIQVVTASKQEELRHWRSLSQLDLRNKRFTST
ncbi:hypothetical protein [Ruegeria lacuscaerulensis]|uniref:hypothetical protein n=1 Tax=Ruegeria lacuscaerulensis TaxID=55218 RepID=UPI00147A9426|nr:hypothetical protein [Ruegeria lacuscaerulensis]